MCSSVVPGTSVCVSSVVPGTTGVSVCVSPVDGVAGVAGNTGLVSSTTV